jgi:hypothetical protein
LVWIYYVPMVKIRTAAISHLPKDSEIRRHCGRELA